MNHANRISKVISELELETGTLSTLDRPQENRVIKTGIQDFDSWHPYGLRRGSLTVLAGRPDMGKSALASQIVLNTAQEYNLSSLIFSTKMQRLTLATRLIHQYSRVPKYPNDMLNDVQRGKIAEARKLIDSLPIFIDDSPAISAKQIKKRVQAFPTEVTNDSFDQIAFCRGLGLIVVDSLECMTPIFSPNVSDKEWGKVMSTLRLIAKAEDVPVLLIANLNRKLEYRNDKRPRVWSDLPHPAIFTYADQIILLHREDCYDPFTPRKNLVEISTYSNRHEDYPFTHCRFIPEYLWCKDLN